MKENYTHPSNYCPDCHRLYCTCPVVEVCVACDTPLGEGDEDCIWCHDDGSLSTALLKQNWHPNHPECCK